MPQPAEGAERTLAEKADGAGLPYHSVVSLGVAYLLTVAEPLASRAFPHGAVASEGRGGYTRSPRVATRGTVAVYRRHAPPREAIENRGARPSADGGLGAHPLSNSPQKLPNRLWPDPLVRPHLAQRSTISAKDRRHVQDPNLMSPNLNVEVRRRGHAKARL